MRHITFTLVRQARKNGGDLYEAVLDKDIGDVWELYVPQSISRKNGVAQQNVAIDISCS